MMNIAIFRHHSMLGYETYAINASSNRHLSCCDLFTTMELCKSDGLLLSMPDSAAP